MEDTTIGLRFVAFDAMGQTYPGASLKAWARLPEPIVLVDVYEEALASTGKPYRWRMECEWFGCKTLTEGRFVFQRWHDTTPPTDASYVWKPGALISDEAMARIREAAG